MKATNVCAVSRERASFTATKGLRQTKERRAHQTKSKGSECSAEQSTSASWQPGFLCNCLSSVASPGIPMVKLRSIQSK
eukprot:6182851-Pleurochrysis_carterae.AAC.4